VIDLKRGLDDDSGEEDTIATTPQQDEDLSSSASSVTKGESRMVRHIRAGIGAAFHGGRRVISTVTLGKVGFLAVDLGIAIVDGQGIELLSTTEQLVCGDRANFELRLTIPDHESCLQLKVKSQSTIHSVYVFASLFFVSNGEEESSGRGKDLLHDVDNPGSSNILRSKPSEQNISGNSANNKAYEKPTQMLRRALTGSRHPERSAFARSLAFACFSSWCGFTLGFSFDTSIALPLALFALVAWTTRALVHVSVVALQT
jgi:hypothetical protein